VRPHLEFATPAWAPWNQGDIDILERVQERAVSGLQGRTYEDRLRELGLPTLAERRAEADLIMAFKILSDSDKDYSAQWFRKMDARRPTRQNNNQNNLAIGRAGHAYRREFFSHRVPEKWNGLPDHVKQASTAAAFKTRLRLAMTDRVTETGNSLIPVRGEVPQINGYPHKGTTGPQRINSQVSSK
jgi:hypothetical protein